MRCKERECLTKSAERLLKQLFTLILLMGLFHSLTKIRAARTDDDRDEAAPAPDDGAPSLSDTRSASELASSWSW